MQLQHMDFIDMRLAARLAGDIDYIHTGKLTLRSGETIALCNPDELWEYVFKSDVSTSKYCMHSLTYLVTPLLEFERTRSEECMLFFERNLQSFLRYMMPHTKCLKFLSEDHAIFNRTMLFCKALMVFPETWSMRDNLIDLLLRQADWMLDDKNYAKYNHGLMTDIGLLHMAVLFRRYGFSKIYGDRAMERIIEMFSTFFDNDGYHNENSVEYAIFCTNKYKNIVEFCKHYKIYEDICQNIVEGLSKVESTLCHIVWQDGTIPPIGDSVKGTSGYASINQSKYFENGNFTIIKDEDTYFSFKCGFSSTTHKHADDTSITLRYKNADLIIDSGYYNYEYQGQYRPVLTSFRGHSCIYPMAYENEEIWALLGKIQDARIVHYSETGSVVQVIGKYTIDNDVNVTRSITYDVGSVHVIDTWQCREPQKMIQRFVMPGNMTILEEVNSSNVIIRDFEHEGVSISYKSSSPCISLKCNMTKGFCSSGAYQIEDALWLDFSVDECHAGQIITDISYKVSDKNATESVKAEHEKPKFSITVDVEAFKRRAKEDYVNHLIYGKIDGETWGIGKMMDIADKHDAKITFFLDYAEVEAYGEEIINVGKYIFERGHDLQLHLHPETLSSDFWNSRKLEKPAGGCDSLDAGCAKACVDFCLEAYRKSTGKTPTVFRGGSYFFSVPLLNVLNSRGLTIDASFNSKTQKLDARSCFVWPNGMLEIPISILKSGQELNFNREAFHPNTSDHSNYVRACDNVKSFLRSYFDEYGNDAIASMVMHSWSFCVGDEGLFDQPNPWVAEYFDYLLGELKGEVDIVSLGSVAQEIIENSSIAEKYPASTSFIRREGCPICGAPRMLITPFNGSVDRRCSVCGGNERQRTLLSLLSKLQTSVRNCAWLHISPMGSENIIVSSLAPKRVTTIDIRPELNTDIVGDISNMPEVFSDSFDVVLLSGVLNHVLRDEDALREIRRVMRVLGKCLIWVNHSGKEDTVDASDPAIWYGKENLEKYNVGTFRYYGSVDFHNMLERYFSVECFVEKDDPSGIECTWYVCTKSSEYGVESGLPAVTD